MIIQNLLSFARQKPALREAVADQRGAAADVETAAYDFSKRDVEVVERFDEDLPAIVGDVHQIQQVFLNIVNNAFDAVRKKDGAHRDETAHANGQIEIRFRTDRGSRMWSRIRTVLHHQGSGQRDRAGLEHLLRNCARALGRNFIFNNADRAGGTFVVRLPLAAEAAM